MRPVNAKTGAPSTGSAWTRTLLAFVVLFSFGVLAQNTATNWLPLPELLKKWEPVSIEQIRQQAEGGDTSAQHYLGYAYAEGLRVPANPSEGVAWYERAMKAGYLPSANNLGLLYQRGRLGSNDLAKAIGFYRFAAERGLAQAQMNLGVLYRAGEGVPADFPTARHWFELAAGQGHASAMVELGRLYRFGNGVGKNPAEAIRWFEKAADEKNSSLARLNLGLLYEGEGDQGKAFRYYLQAAEAGDPEAMAQVYLCYWEAKGVAADHAKAMEWLKKSAEANSPFGECLMGYRCENTEWVGEGPTWHQLPVDLPAALRWYRKSAAQNWVGGQYHLGLMYLEGKAEAQDEARGLELIRAAADQEHEDAMLELANLYARDVGEPRNGSERPMALLERLGKWEDLLFRYEYGLGTERDLVLAARCCCKLTADLQDKVEFKGPTVGQMGTQILEAPDDRLQILGPPRHSAPLAGDDVMRVLSTYLKAARGDGAAALRLGTFYENGVNAPPSAMSAWAWFSFAGRNGSAPAREKIAALEKQLSTDEMKSAQKRLAVITADLREVAEILR
jgi:TPR repeat protein